MKIIVYLPPKMFILVHVQKIGIGLYGMCTNLFLEAIWISAQFGKNEVIKLWISTME